MKRADDEMSAGDVNWAYETGGEAEATRKALKIVDAEREAALKWRESE